MGNDLSESGGGSANPDFGFSTGCVFRREPRARAAISLFLGYGLSGLEISLASADELHWFEPDAELLEIRKQFSRLSLHAPFHGIRYRNDPETLRVLKKIGFLCEVLGIEDVVFHPDVVDDFAPLLDAGVGICIENMDRRKATGVTVREFEAYSRMERVRFVFDLQHAFEHDRLGMDSQSMLELMLPRLSHFHLSGFNQFTSHALLKDSENRDIVSDFAVRNRIFEKSIVLEGNLMGDPASDIENEIRLMEQLTNTAGGIRRGQATLT